jgi:hypothetical protein
MDGNTVGVALLLLVGLIVFVVWVLGRARGQAPPNPFDLDRGVGPDRNRHFGKQDPTPPWQSPGDGRW